MCKELIISENLSLLTDSETLPNSVHAESIVPDGLLFLYFLLVAALFYPATSLGFGYIDLNCGRTYAALIFFFADDLAFGLCVLSVTTLNPLEV